MKNVAAKTIFFFILFIAGLGTMGTSTADTLDDIRARGTIVIGVKKDVLLWGSVDKENGNLIGLEPDLAKDIAKSLDVKLKLVGLFSAERIEALEQRKVDVLIATLSDTPERREKVTLAEPHYYASGVNILTRKSEKIQSWDDLRNRRICARRGAFYNRPVTVEHGADIVALYSNDLLKAALRDGRCKAYLYDDTAITALLLEPEWASNFEMPLATLYPTPWSVALHKGDKGSKLEKSISDAIVRWHRSGFLKTAEANWKIPPSQFVTQMNKVWNKRVDARWYCGETLGATTPKDCL
jgi:polar amino acid transport system substrate-binding protein